MTDTNTHKYLFFLFFFFCFLFLGIASVKANYNNSSLVITPEPQSISDESKTRNSPAATIVWGKNQIRRVDNSYSFFVESPVQFSYFGVGWKTNDDSLDTSDFVIRYRTWSGNIEPGNWKSTQGEYSPEENKSGLYRSDVIFVNDSILHDFVEIIITSAKNVIIDSLVVDLVGFSKNDTPNFSEKSSVNYYSTTDCPPPSIIPRTNWCGGFGACNNPQYQPEIIQPTHVVIHHGGSPDSYVDGYSVVRGYWDYHVNSLGWDDIGYNYLIDKNGNIFQGRHNPYLFSQDVKGAHAGNVNGKAIGVCFLGNSDKTYPTVEQISRLEELLAYWFNFKNIDPVVKNLIINQAGTDTLFLPRIVGHRDIKPATICPGDMLYDALTNIRMETRIKMLSCSNRKLSTDILVDNLSVFPSEIIGGGSVTVTSRFSVSDDIKDLTESPSLCELWLSEDTIFNPTKDILFDLPVSIENSDSVISTEYKINKYTAPGKYYFFLVADRYNSLWESDEMNNELFVPLSIHDNSSMIAVNTVPSNGGVVSGAGKYFNGDTCNLFAENAFGYEFQGWYEGESLISKGFSISMTVEKPRSITAQFKCSDYFGDPNIEGNFTVCQGDKNVAYSIPEINNGLSYEWSLPSGVSGFSKSNSIIVSFSNVAESGIIKVVADIGCANLFPEAIDNIDVKNKPPRPEIFIEDGALFSNHGYNELIIYDWFKDSIKVSELKLSDNFKPSELGDYYLIESTDFCSSDPSEKVFFDYRKYFSEEESNRMVIFPNPAENILEIIFSELQENGLEISFYDSSSRLRLKSRNRLKSNHYLIDVSDLEKGVYIVNFRINGTVNHTKFLKK